MGWAARWAAAAAAAQTPGWVAGSLPLQGSTQRPDATANADDAVRQEADAGAPGEALGLDGALDPGRTARAVPGGACRGGIGTDGAVLHVGIGTRRGEARGSIFSLSPFFFTFVWFLRVYDDIPPPLAALRSGPVCPYGRTKWENVPSYIQGCRKSQGLSPVAHSGD